VEALTSDGLRQKSALAQTINYNGRGMAISEECEIPQKTQIAPLQIPLQPGARYSPQQCHPHDSSREKSAICSHYRNNPPLLIARVTCSLARFVMAVTAEAEIRAYGIML
jgi:hypothetical protein